MGVVTRNPELGRLKLRPSSSTYEELEDPERLEPVEKGGGGVVDLGINTPPSSSSGFKVLQLSLLPMELSDPSQLGLVGGAPESFLAFCISVHSLETTSVMSSCCLTEHCSSSCPPLPLGRGANEEEALDIGEGSNDERLSRHIAESRELVELFRPSWTWVWGLGRGVAVTDCIQGCCRHWLAVRRALIRNKEKDIKTCNYIICTSHVSV